MNLQRRPPRLRSRVTLVATAVTFIVMSLAAFAMLAFQRDQLFNAVDVSLQESVVEVSRELEVSFERDEEEGEDDSSEDENDLGSRVSSSSRPLQLIASDGTVATSSRPLTNEPALVKSGDIADMPRTNAGDFSTVEGTSSRFRVAATRVKDGQVLVAGYSLADVDASLQTQRATLLIAIPLLSALVGLLVWSVLGKALKPVEEIRTEVAGIGGHELDRRVSVPGTVELGSLAETMNSMLARLDESATRQNRFVSDAAHELRSPLAGIRAQLEVNIHHPDAPGRAESEQDVLNETVRMQELVDNLLMLARADHGTLKTPRIEVDLDDLVLEEASNLKRKTSLEVNLAAVSAARVLGDQGQLRRVIRNLADNAGRHGETTVRFDLSENVNSVRLVVSNDGPPISTENAELIFSRFTRLDESRDRDVGGSGLGLSICREIVENHGGTIRTETQNEGASFIIELPKP